MPQAQEAAKKQEVTEAQTQQTDAQAPQVSVESLQTTIAELRAEGAKQVATIEGLKQQIVTLEAKLPPPPVVPDPKVVALEAEVSALKAENRKNAIKLAVSEMVTASQYAGHFSDILEMQGVKCESVEAAKLAIETTEKFITLVASRLRDGVKPKAIGNGAPKQEAKEESKTDAVILSAFGQLNTTF